MDFKIQKTKINNFLIKYESYKMSALKNFLDRISIFHHEVINMESIYYFYLNGEKMDISFHDVKPPNPIPLSFIREHIKEIIPEDFIFLNNDGEIIDNDEEDKIFSVEDGEISIHHIYSETLYNKKKSESKNMAINIDDFKVLEMKEEFNIYEYSHKELKNEDFYSIVLIGDMNNNIKFVDGFLNYLYGIRKEDKIRLKYEDFNKNEKKEIDFYKVMNIQHEKGNFKFHCFNFGTDNFIGLDELVIFGKIIDNDNKEVHIDLIVFNKIDFSYEKRFQKKIFDDYMKEIGKGIVEKGFQKDSNFFFVEPNILFSSIRYNVLLYTIDCYGFNRPENSYDKSRIDMKKYKNVFLNHYFNFDSIYETKSDKKDLCEFNQVMEGFSTFYNSLINAPKQLQCEKLRQYYYSIFKIYFPLAKNYIIFKENKLDINMKIKQKNDFKPNIDQLSKVSARLSFLEEKNTQIMEFITHYKDKILKKPNFLIPCLISTDKNNSYPHCKTNVCNICRYNCHKHCKDIVHKFCKSFDLTFNCKKCPNKCPSSAHVVVNYEFPTFEYKTIDQIFPNSEDDITKKIEYVSSQLEKDHKEICDKLDHIKNEISNIGEVTDISKIDMKTLNQKLNDSIYEFDKNYIYLEKKGPWEEELFRYFLYVFLKVKYEYEYVDD